MSEVNEVVGYRLHDQGKSYPSLGRCYLRNPDLPRDFSKDPENTMTSDKKRAWLFPNLNDALREGGEYYYTKMPVRVVRKKAPEAPFGYFVREKSLHTSLYRLGCLGCSISDAYGEPVRFPTRSEAEKHLTSWREVVPATDPDLDPAPTGQSFVVRKTDVVRFRTRKAAKEACQSWGLRGYEVRLEADAAAAK